VALPFRTSVTAASRAAEDDAPGLPPLAPPTPMPTAGLAVTPIGEPSPIGVAGLTLAPLSPADLNGSGRP
jgi:hypothetical protein